MFIPARNYDSWFTKPLAFIRPRSALIASVPTIPICWASMFFSKDLRQFQEFGPAAIPLALGIPGTLGLVFAGLVFWWRLRLAEPKK